MKRFKIPKEEFITGDTIQSLCDFIFDIDNFINTTKYTGSIQDLINKQIEQINLNQPSIIFVFGHDTEKFLLNKDKIINPFKLVTHNSDLGIYEKYIPHINEKILKWYGQNNYIQHKKVFALPIGLARSRWPHGNLDLFKSIIDKNNPKINLVYKNFNIGTNVNERICVNNITNNNKIFMDQPTSIEQYWDKLSKSCFSVSPKGNGIDCHRIWESLYLNTIPIVQKHQALAPFENLPILFIDNWEQVTHDFLKNKLDLFEKFNNNSSLNMLKLSYWKKCIENE